MKILVIGGNGFVGSHLCRALRAADEMVFCGDRSTQRGHTTDTRAGFRNVYIDISRLESVIDCLTATEPDLVINLASCTGESYEDVAPVIVQGPVNLIMAICRAKLPTKLITFGSAAEYGNLPDSAMPLHESTRGSPVGLYGIAKLVASIVAQPLARDLGVKLWVIRPFNIVGAGCPNTLFVGAIIDRILAALEKSSTPEIVVGRMDTCRDFVGVVDVIEAVRALSHRDVEAGVYNVCSGRPTRLDSIMESLRRISGVSFTWRVDPSLVRPTDPMMSYGSNTKLACATGFKPAESIENELSDAWNYALARNRQRLA